MKFSTAALLSVAALVQAEPDIGDVVGDIIGGAKSIYSEAVDGITDAAGDVKTAVQDIISAGESAVAASGTSTAAAAKRVIRCSIV